MTRNEAKTLLRDRALALGFDDLRVAPAIEAPHAEVFREWVAEGKFGDMGWLERNVDRRTDPRVVVPGARSVLVLAMNYFQGEPPKRATENGARGTIARYAWNDDYHDLIEARLKELYLVVEELGGKGRYYVDTGPVLERDFAHEAGLGWNGKSTVQIHRKLGTWFFLAVIVTTLDLEPDEPARDHCGKCTACIDSCPTNAITGPHRMDARLCISYLTIEHKGPIPVELRRPMGDRIYGCDDCLDACPWNRFAQVSREASFQAREPVFDKSLREFLALDDDEFRSLFRKSPIKRSKRDRFLRNVCVALGNVGSEEDLPALSHAVENECELIAEHARWAIDEISRRSPRD